MRYWHSHSPHSILHMQEFATDTERIGLDWLDHRIIIIWKAQASARVQNTLIKLNWLVPVFNKKYISDGHTHLKENCIVSNSLELGLSQIIMNTITGLDLPLYYQPKGLSVAGTFMADSSSWRRLIKVVKLLLNSIKVLFSWAVLVPLYTIQSNNKILNSLPK